MKYNDTKKHNAVDRVIKNLYLTITVIISNITGIMWGIAIMLYEQGEPSIELNCFAALFSVVTVILLLCYVLEGKED